MGENVKQIKSRWNAKLNKFWKIILRISLTVALSCAGVMTLDQVFALESHGVSPTVFTVCSYVLTASGFMGFAAKLTKA